MLARLRTNCSSFSDNKSVTSEAAEPSVSVIGFYKLVEPLPCLAPLVAGIRKREATDVASRFLFPIIRN